MDKKKRPRTKSIQERMAGAEEVKDDKAYVKNKSSAKAKLAATLKETLIFDVYHDIHYTYRNQIGDENGKREGIGHDAVIELIENGLKHLLFYSSRVKGFTFLNHENSDTDTKIRLVLQDSYSEEVSLNVVIEVHFINFNKYEITIITAMRINGFNISVGQHLIDFIDKDHSILKKNDVGNIVEIFDCQD